MVEFTFDATKYEPLADETKLTPAKFALRRWLQYTNEDDDMPLDLACALAPFDYAVYDALWKWAVDVGLSNLSEAAQADVGVALVRSKPTSKRVGVTKRRNARLRALAVELHKVYSLPFAQAQAGGNTACVAGVLATLKFDGIPSEVTIAGDILKGLGKT